MTTATLLVEHAMELATLSGPPGARRGAAQAEVGIVRDGAVAADANGRIVAVGTTDEIRAAVQLAPDAIVLDASKHAVLPAFVDPHTHAVFGGDRADEFARRLAGEDYLAILAQGGGILSTVRATRESDEATLAGRASAALERMLLHGTATVEIKSGYGLDTQSEVRLLRVAQAVGRTRAPRTVGTLLAAHAVPPEYAGDPDGYVSLVCEEIIPEVARQGLARFCDVFAEKGVFSVEQARRVLETGSAHGLRPKLHAEQKSLLGGTRLAAEVRAASADHLEHADEESLQALANARDTVAVLLPGAAFMLRETRDAPARRMIELGVPVALATDYNPGTSPILSMPLAIGLACVRLGLAPAEALVAATINAAHAICLGDEVGSLEVGKRADMLILDAPSYAHLPYHFGSNLVRTVIKDGRVVAHAGEVLG